MYGPSSLSFLSVFPQSWLTLVMILIKKKNFLIEESYGYIFHDYVKSTSRLNRQ